MSQQKTISKPATIEAPGLFSGLPSRLRFLPAEADRGLVFVRNNAQAKSIRIACDVANLAARPRRTSLQAGQAVVDTVEHVLSAVAGLGIDNLTMELDADETPSTDGSPLPFVKALTAAGIVEQDAARRTFAIGDPIVVRDAHGSLAALPGGDEGLEILYELDYRDTPAVGRQYFSFTLGQGDYTAEIAPARTFLLKAEADALQARGMGTHLTYKDIPVIGDDGPIDNTLRFGDEPVRHKLGDLIGDLTLVGRPLTGRIVASRSGHALNHTLARRLQEAIDVSERADAMGASAPPMDIHKILRLLPHRYPFLMIDRVIELDGERRAVGIKNVTINEPFFQGHYPGQPIMPGVLTLEAMAQLAGLLLSRRLDHTGKVAVLLSMDRVKMRRPVRPGDQLILEAETIRVRSRTGHCRCRARVGDEIAAEAEIKFMLVDADKG